MKVALSDEEGNIEDESVVSRSLVGDDRLKGDDSSTCSLLRSKYSLEMIESDGSVTLGGRSCVDAKRCFEKSHVQKQCDIELNMHNLESFCSLEKNMVPYVDGFSEFKSPHSLSIVCKSSSPFRFPMNLSTSSFLLDTRRTRSTTDLGNLIVEYASSPDGPSSIIINRYGKWIIDPKEEDSKRSIWRKSLLLSLGDLESNWLNKAVPVSLGKAKPPPVKCLSNAPFDSSSNKSRSEAIPFNKIRPSSMPFDEMFKSCSSSVTSGLSADTTTKAFLHLIWKGGIVYFVFMVDDETSETYVANPCKVSSPKDKTLDFVYSFYSCGCQHKNFGRFSSRSLNLVGKMNVSSCLGFNPNSSRFLETEFVLFGAMKDHARKSQNLSNLKNLGLSRKVTDILKKNYSSKNKSRPQYPSQDKLEKFLPGVNKVDMLDKLDGQNVVKECSPNSELAAIIIKDVQLESNKENEETVVGGWGLKFLKKVSINHPVPSAPVDTRFSNTGCQESRMVEEASSRSINVLIPAGLHGVPSTASVGPSSLTERWKSGGHCECGGWDIGCPLTVLENGSNNVEAFGSQRYSKEQQKSFSLFAQGRKQGEGALRMVYVREGLYSIYFQSSLSVLQSFSIGVAIIHNSQTPAICENCKYRA